MLTATRRLFALASDPQVQPGWSNYDGTATIYITSDSGLNQISLTFLNQFSDTVTLPAGTPVEYGSLPDGQSAIYLFFEGLISNDEVQAIEVTPLTSAQWATKVFTDASGLAYMVLAPVAEVQVPNGQALDFKLTGVTATAANAGPVYVTFAGASGISPDEATSQVFVSVQNAPATGNQALDLVVGFSGGDLVFTGGQTNELTLFLSNPNPAALVPGGSAAWGPSPPSFQLSLVFGTGAGALTTTAEAAGIAVNISDAFGNVWKPVAKQSQGQNPTWVMQPDPNGGGQVLGTGANATIAFAITGIQTQLPQGLTLAYLSYTNIPGYNDGYVGLEIVKVNPITVVSFTANPPSVTNAVSGTQVALSFEVNNASYVSVTNTAYARATTSATLNDSVGATIYSTTTYTLLASNFATGQQLAVPLEVSVSPDPFHLVPTGTIVMWSGSTVPVGWAICDGTGGTPNLVSKFIMGAELSGIGATGGTTSHTHQASATVSIQGVGNHTHGVPSPWYSNTASSGKGITIVDRRATSVTGAQTQSAGGHTHGATAAVTVQPAGNLPPYYALAFIIKTS